MSNYMYMKFYDLNSILNYFTIKKNSTLEDTIKYLNIDIKVDSKKLNRNIYSFLDDKELYNKFNLALSLESTKVNKITLEYLMQEQMKNNFSIVDIGWNGTMQKCLITFLNNNKIKFEMNGYYFLMLNKLKNSYSYIKLHSEISHSILDNPLLIENLFQCIDGSTVGYRKENNLIFPVKKEIEFNNYSIEAIKNIDDGIIDFIISWKKYGFCLNHEKFKKDSLNRMMKFIDKPKSKDIKYFLDFCYSDIKNDGKIISKDTNLKKGLYNSGWKYGYLKFKFRLNLNFKFIIKLLKGIKSS